MYIHIFTRYVEDIKLHTYQLLLQVIKKKEKKMQINK